MHIEFQAGSLGLSPTKPSKRPVSNTSNQAALGLGDFAYCPAPAVALHSSDLHSLHPVSVHLILDSFLDLQHINPHEAYWISSPGPFEPTQPLSLLSPNRRSTSTLVYQYLEAHDRLHSPLYLHTTLSQHVSLPQKNRWRRECCIQTCFTCLTD